MKKRDIEMIQKILDSDNMGYAYHYPKDGGERQEVMIALTPENIANYIGSHFHDAGKIIITDVADRLVLDTFGCFVNQCPDKGICKEVNSFLVPLQTREKEVGEVLQVSRDVADEYFAEEDQAVTMAEYGMR